jgi:ABC-type sulfate/molybdate transport systems ATPase subunit
MPWLDQIVILQNGRLIQNDSPEETYRHPYNSYVAKLSEVNIFTEKEITDFQLSKFSYYPKEIKLQKMDVS